MPFLQWQKNKLPENLECKYYLSFEDALWHIFSNKRVKFLVPDFYCSDVLDNIREHGHEYVYYPLDKDFQISNAKFIKYLWLYQPDVVIIFHAAGVSSQLLIDTNWLSEIPEDCVIIEDSVQRLVDPRKTKPINNSHVVIDSLRKVSPIPGSRVFGKPDFFDKLPKRTLTTWHYAPLAFLYYLIFRLGLRLGFTTWAFDKALKRHDDLVGNDFGSALGIPFFWPLINRLNYNKIYKNKEDLVKIYEDYLKKIYINPLFYKIEITEEDFGKLHVYPVGINGPPPEKLIRHLHNNKILVWYKFTDTPWSKNRGILFLPLGFHIKENDIKKIGEVLGKW